MTADRQEHQAQPDDATLRLRGVRQGRLLAGPETLQLNLCNACNLSCIFCWNHSPLRPSPHRSWQTQRLSDRHMNDLIASLPRLRPARVLLSGRGEPLLHPGVERLLAELQRSNLPVTIQTNGVGGPSIDALAGLGVERILVNLSAATEAGYLQTHPRASRELYLRALDRLRQAARIRRERGEGPAISMVAVIQRTNQHELAPLLELCAEIDADQLFLKGMELQEGLESLVLDDGERDHVREELERVRRMAADTRVTVQAEHLEQVLSCSAAATRAGAMPFTESMATGPCYMGWYYLRVTCEGQVMFCCKDKLIDHLDRRSLYQIWRSPAYHLQRLAGRDGDTSTGLFDDKCRTCSNFGQNRRIARELAKL